MSWIFSKIAAQKKNMHQAKSEKTGLNSSERMIISDALGEGLRAVLTLGQRAKSLDLGVGLAPRAGWSKTGDALAHPS